MGFVDDNIMSHVERSDMFVACGLVTPRAVFVIPVHSRTAPVPWSELVSQFPLLQRTTATSLGACLYSRSHSEGWMPRRELLGQDYHVARAEKDISKNEAVVDLTLTVNINNSIY